MRTRIFATIVIVLLVLGLAGCGSGFKCEDEWGCVEIKQGETVKIAYVGPTTGDYSSFGVDMSRGAELAVKGNPDIQGFPVELVVEDTQGTPEQGAAVANKLASDPRIVGIAGHTFSGSTEAAIPIYEDAHIAMVSPSATTPELTKLGSEIFNRIAFTDEQQGEAAAKYIYEVLGVKKVALIHDGGAYGQGLAEGMGAFFETLGGTVVAKEAITPGETDYSAPLAAIAAAAPELIYYGGYDADAAVLVSQMRGAGLTDVKFFGCDGTYGIQYINLAGAESEGSFSTYVPIPESAAFTAFRDAYKAAYGDEQGELSPFSPHAHDSTALILYTVEKIAVKDGNNLYVPRKGLADAIRATADYAGLTGSITCSDTGECAAASILFMIVENGAWTTGPGQ